MLVISSRSLRAQANTGSGRHPDFWLDSLKCLKMRFSNSLLAYNYRNILYVGIRYDEQCRKSSRVCIERSLEAQGVRPLQHMIELQLSRTVPKPMHKFECARASISDYTEAE